MRIFLFLLVLSGLAAGAFLFGRRVPEGGVVPSVSSVAVETGAPLGSLGLGLPSEESGGIRTAYQHGYELGYRSFLRQVGDDVPLPSSRYVSEEGHDTSEEESRGYVDGYHRASEGFHCPAGCVR